MNKQSNNRWSKQSNKLQPLFHRNTFFNTNNIPISNPNPIPTSNTNNIPTSNTNNIPTSNTNNIPTSNDLFQHLVHQSHKSPEFNLNKKLNIKNQLNQVYRKDLYVEQQKKKEQTRFKSQNNNKDSILSLFSNTDQKLNLQRIQKDYIIKIIKKNNLPYNKFRNEIEEINHQNILIKKEKTKEKKQMQNIKFSSTLSLIQKKPKIISDQKKGRERETEMIWSRKNEQCKTDSVDGFRKNMLRNIGSMSREKIGRQANQLKYDIMSSGCGHQNSLIQSISRSRLDVSNQSLEDFKCSKVVFLKKFQYNGNSIQL